MSDPEHARRMLEHAGISVNEADEVLMQQFLERLRRLPAPALTTEPWLVPGQREWRRE